MTLSRDTPQTAPFALTDEEIATLPADGGPHFNRLVFEKSPYLRQHAANPIDWHPWSDEAFGQARRRDCPVLLSIGYSTCHWCHVMARESFENQQVADLINRHFVAIKVDREERPDIDATYLTVCQLMTGSGGWPLTLLLTPDRRPFFAATYLPPRTRNGQPGLIEVLTKVRRMWDVDRRRLLLGADRVVGALKQIGDRRDIPGSTGESLLKRALDQYRNVWDPVHAGFGPPPRFPAPHNLELLLRLARRFGDNQARDMALETLSAIRLGGIYDQVGFGIHRYAVDRRWLVPHFEKMLYDQALLMLAASRAGRQGGGPFFARIAVETADYLLRELQHPEGGFYCGEDADSEGAEGTFYLWDEAAIRTQLSPAEAELAVRAFGMTSAGNFEGRNILTLDRDYAEDPRLAAIRAKLLQIRSGRVRPHRDEKLLTGWNGLAIAALARTGAAFNRPELLEAARRAADFVLCHLRRNDGRLLRRYCDGEAAIPAFLEDYAFFGLGLMELFLADFRGRWLREARQLAGEMLELFSDTDGGLYDTGQDSETILVRSRNLQDGALPSGISVATGLLLHLGRLTGETSLEQAGRKLLLQHLGLAERYPRAHAWLLSVLDSHLDPEPVLVIAPGDREDPAPWMELARQQGPVDLMLLVATDDVRQLGLPALTDRPAIAGRTTAWYCDRHTCRPPVTEPGQLGELFAKG